MSKKNFLSGRDKELQDMADEYETAKNRNQPFYLDADDWADLTDWYVLRHKDDRAMEVVEHGLSQHPDNTILQVEKAYLLLDTGQLKEADAFARTIGDNTPEVLILKAGILMEEGHIAEAEQLLDGIEDKDDLANIMDVTYMYIDAGYPEKAQKWLSRGTELHAGKEPFLAVSGDCCYAQGLYEEAAAYYNELIDLQPYSAPYWFGLARCYFEQRIYDKAINACEYAVISDEEFADAYVLSGHSYYQLGNNEAALENYRKAVQLGALSEGFIHFFIGLNKTFAGEWEEGLQHLEQAIACKYDTEETATLPTLYANAALCLHKLGKKRKAHQYCKKALEHSPDNLETYLIEGRIYMEEGNYEKGVDQWAKALQIAPEASTWHEIGIDSLEAGHLEYARLALERVKELEPDFEDINEKLTALYMILKDKENFLKYNQLCKHPCNMKELEMLQKMLDDDNQEELGKAMKSIFDSLK